MHVLFFILLCWRSALAAPTVALAEFEGVAVKGSILDSLNKQNLSLIEKRLSKEGYNVVYPSKVRTALMGRNFASCLEDCSALVREELGAEVVLTGALSQEKGKYRFNNLAFDSFFIIFNSW